MGSFSKEEAKGSTGSTNENGGTPSHHLKCAFKLCFMAASELSHLRVPLVDASRIRHRVNSNCR